MACETCGKGPKEGVNLYRQGNNSWRCIHCYATLLSDKLRQQVKVKA